MTDPEGGTGGDPDGDRNDRRPEGVGDRDPADVVAALRDLPARDDLTEPIRNRRRRTVIRLLDRLPPDETLTVQELARACAAVETDAPPHRVANSDYRRAYDGLRQRDVSRLATAGVVERRGDEVGRGERFERYAALLRAVDDALGGTGEG